jgi:hypothetical protein
MSMTEAEIAYYLATLIIHDIEPQKAMSKKDGRKARRR